MDEIEEKLRRILKFIENVPEPFKMKCFDILSNTSFYPNSNISNNVTHHTKSNLSQGVRNFLNKNNLPEDIVEELFNMGEDIQPIYTIDSSKKAVAQTQIALLLAFQNALTTSTFDFEISELRQICKNRDCYDFNTFSTNLKKKKDLFITVDDKKYSLTNKGKEELAKVISMLTKND